MINQNELLIETRIRVGGIRLLKGIVIYHFIKYLQKAGA